MEDDQLKLRIKILHEISPTDFLHEILIQITIMLASIALRLPEKKNEYKESNQANRTSDSHRDYEAHSKESQDALLSSQGVSG